MFVADVKCQVKDGNEGTNNCNKIYATLFTTIIQTITQIN